MLLLNKKKIDMNETIAKILNLCDTDPDQALSVINALMNENKILESMENLQFCKARAFQTKGLKPIAERSGISESELRKYFTEDDLNNLELALSEYKRIGDEHPDFIEGMGADWWDGNLTTIARILDRCRPGMVQNILHKTKFKFFGIGRIRQNPYIDEIPPEFLKPYYDTWFEYQSLVKSAIIFVTSTDSEGRGYVEFWLFGKTFDDFSENAPIEDEIIGKLFIFDDKQYSVELPEKPLNNNLTQENMPNPKKGFFKKLLG